LEGRREWKEERGEAESGESEEFVFLFFFFRFVSFEKICFWISFLFLSTTTDQKHEEEFSSSQKFERYKAKCKCERWGQKKRQ
jgi:hypothetical protein